MVRMDNLFPNQNLFSQLWEGTRKRGHPNIQYKEVLKRNLKTTSSTHLAKIENPGEDSYTVNEACSRCRNCD